MAQAKQSELKKMKKYMKKQVDPNDIDPDTGKPRVGKTDEEIHLKDFDRFEEEFEEITKD
jgi:hypothetical protein